ncbi:zf-HC2 domain-containing protein [Micromonospora sp. NPDC049274]|uniref:zf-HC2 domain-containing protein n=1 Tax=Micromonospora sp. NPDC049274 TaxID=3154829 RepID=UPI003438876B
MFCARHGNPQTLRAIWPSTPSAPFARPRRRAAQTRLRGLLCSSALGTTAGGGQRSMTCDQARQGRVSMYLLGLLDSPTEEEFERHLGSCATCLQESEDLHSVTTAMLQTMRAGQCATAQIPRQRTGRDNDPSEPGQP